jgi:UDP-N-acetylmuramoyl-tripeptide--D-alanyl-D-alanine ligase
MKQLDIEQLYQYYRSNPIVSIDTRNLVPGSLFFAIKGENFNGNTFTKKALKEGAKMVVIDEEQYAMTEGTILVENALDALQELARYHRSQLRIPVIGITGSNGKTTTKELMREVLSQKFNVLATEGNLNNHIGVPLTLLSITEEHDLAIIEMGANHPKEIEFLCTIANPDFGLITNIGKAHIEGFGSFQGVIDTKKELYTHIIRKKAKLFLNTDDALLCTAAGGYKNCATYGETASADIQGVTNGSGSFVEVKWNRRNEPAQLLKTKLFGQYNVPNVMAALCVGNHFGVSPEAMNKAISAYVPANNRSQLVKTAKNTIVLDAYNANPSSMRLAIESFYGLEEENKVVILGDMRELGIEAGAEHLYIMNLTVGRGFKLVLLVGEEFGKMKAQEGQKQFSDHAALSEWLKKNPITGAHILIKGSRGIQLEKVVPVIP